MRAAEGQRRLAHCTRPPPRGRGQQIAGRGLESQLMPSDQILMAIRACRVSHQHLPAGHNARRLRGPTSWNAPTQSPRATKPRLWHPRQAPAEEPPAVTRGDAVDSGRTTGHPVRHQPGSLRSMVPLEAMRTTGRKPCRTQEPPISEISAASTNNVINHDPDAPGPARDTPPPHESRWCGARCPGSPTRVQGRPASRSTQFGPFSTLRTNGACSNPRSPRSSCAGRHL